MQIQLSDVKVGTVTPPQVWSNEERKLIDLDFRDVFLSKLHDRNFNYSKQLLTQSLFYAADDLPFGVAYHKNYLDYLTACWKDHLGIVITPDILWYTLLCEVASLVKSDPEKYRHLFSCSEEKQEVTVITAAVVMPLDLLIDALKELVPADIGKFFPEFSTSTPRSQHAFRTTFCDAISPYYQYSTMMCGFPFIDIRGTEDDYNLLNQKWKEITELLGSEDPWFQTVQQTIENCIHRRTDAEWWKAMISVERCGSGSDIKVFGWFPDLFRMKPEEPYPKNFPTCVSRMEYKNLSTNRFYVMQEGLFSSTMDGDALVPEFGFVVHQKLDVEPEPVVGSSKSSVERLLARASQLM